MHKYIKHLLQYLHEVDNHCHVTAGHKQIGPLSLKATMVTRLVTQTLSTHGLPQKLHAK